MALAAKLKELRLRKGKSLQELAGQVGASKAHIWDLEMGRAKNPTIELLTKLANALGTSISDLVGENATDADAHPHVLSMYRELKGLSESDLEAIRNMVSHLKGRSS